MKKVIFILLVLFGLQTKAQVVYCDSMSYTTGVSPVLTVTGNASGLSNIIDSIVWSWQACNSTMCYSGSGTTATFQNILSTDTVKVCYYAYIYSMGATYICTDCNSLIYDANSYSWILFNTGNPTSIEEVDVYSKKRLKIYDLLGRELRSVPIGKMYIRNSKLYISK